MQLDVRQGRGEKRCGRRGGGGEWAVRLEGERHDADRLLCRGRAREVIGRALGLYWGAEIGTEVDGRGSKVIGGVELRAQRNGRPEHEVAEGRGLLRRDRRDRNSRRDARAHRWYALDVSLCLVLYTDASVT